MLRAPLIVQAFILGPLTNVHHLQARHHQAVGHQRPRSVLRFVTFTTS